MVASSANIAKRFRVGGESWLPRPVCHKDVDIFCAHIDGGLMSRPLSNLRRTILKSLFAGLSALFVGRSTHASPKTKIVRLQKWTCTNQDCDPYIYDPSIGDINIIDEDRPIPPGVAFDDLPEDWICHVCRDPKSHFEPMDEWVEVTIAA